MKINLLAFVIVSVFTLSSFTSSEVPTKIRFYTDSYDNFLREVRKQNKPALIEFTASWCQPCKKMDAETYADPEFAAYINKNYLIYRIDADSFDGMEIAERFAVKSYPTLILLDAKAKFVNSFKGFFPPNYLMNELENAKKPKEKRPTLASNS